MPPTPMPTPAPTPPPTPPPTPAPPTPAPTPSPLGCKTWPGLGTQTVFTATAVPAAPANTDGRELVLGTRFVTNGAGDITAVRFFRPAQAGGVKTQGRVYDAATKTLLSSSLFEAEDESCTGAGWVSLALVSPIRSAPGREYVVAIDPVMWYAKSDNFFLSSRTSDGGGVTLLRGGGVYQVVRNVMPDIPSGGTILGATNYWLDGTSEAALRTAEAS